MKLFLDNLVASAVLLLVMLAVLLIYSLMISDVEEKTYEFGMLRALGSEKNSIVLILLFEALVFALPGLSLGLLMAYIINVAVSVVFYGQT
jgi:ABC-type lipoprotein release transport system permease subunit